IDSHCDSCPQPDYHAEVGRRGAFIEFDLVRGTSEWETDRHLRWIRSLWDQGFGHQVLLSQDVCKPRHLHAYGGFGYDHILVEFVPRLISAGFSQEQIDIMLIANPAAALSGCRI